MEILIVPIGGRVPRVNTCDDAPNAARAAAGDTRTLPQLGAASNLRLLAVVTLTGAAQVGMHFVPGIRAVFGLHPLTLGEIGLCFLLGLIPVTILEVTKLVRGARG